MIDKMRLFHFFYFVAFDGLHQPFGLYYFFRLKEGFLSINQAMIDRMRLFHFFYFVAFDGLHQPFGLYYFFQAKRRLPEHKLSND